MGLIKSRSQSVSRCTPLRYVILWECVVYDVATVKGKKAHDGRDASSACVILASVPLLGFKKYSFIRLADSYNLSSVPSHPLHLSLILPLSWLFKSRLEPTEMVTLWWILWRFQGKMMARLKASLYTIKMWTVFSCPPRPDYESTMRRKQRKKHTAVLMKSLPKQQIIFHSSQKLCSAKGTLELGLSQII